MRKENTKYPLEQRELRFGTLIVRNHSFPEFKVCVLVLKSYSSSVYLIFVTPEQLLRVAEITIL